LTALLSAERSDALAAVQATKLSEERERALEYYVGDVTMDIPDVDGRSRAVSMDVADTIEGLMPQLMEIFCSSDEVVKFEPVGPEDVRAADQETDYVNHVFMQKNPGFMVLYSMIKDALLSKVGVVKVWWEQDQKEYRETYLDLNDDAYAVLAADPEVEIVEHSMRPAYAEAATGLPATSPGAEEISEGSAAAPGMDNGPMLHDVTIAIKKTYGCAKVMPVPPEEFGITRHTRTIAEAGYCFHEIPRTIGQLLDQGYVRRTWRRYRAIPSMRRGARRETKA
jgi:hypothetical protein